MHEKLVHVRRMAGVVVAATALLLGVAVTPVEAAAKDKGTIQVCKTVKGKSKDLNFTFDLKKYNAKKKKNETIKTFKLGKGDCLLVKKVAKGEYTVTEKSLPSGFKLKVIKVKGNDGYFNVKLRSAYFKVNNDKTVATFVNQCTDKKNKNCKG